MKKTPNKKAYMGLYGNVVLPKAYCVDCDRVALVLE